jgi:hypothetical protein
MAAGNDLLNKPNLEQRITKKCVDVAGAIAHRAYKFVDATLGMTICAAEDVTVHGVAVVAGIQNEETAFDTAGIVLMSANGTIELGDPLQTDANGEVIKQGASDHPVIGHAYSAALDGELVSVRLGK